MSGIVTNTPYPEYRGLSRGDARRLLPKPTDSSSEKTLFLSCPLCSFPILALSHAITSHFFSNEWVEETFNTEKTVVTFTVITIVTSCFVIGAYIFSTIKVDSIYKASAKRLNERHGSEMVDGKTIAFLLDTNYSAYNERILPLLSSWQIEDAKLYTKNPALQASRSPF